MCGTELALLLSHINERMLGWVLSVCFVYKLSWHQGMCHCCGGKPGNPGLGVPACGGAMPGLQPGGGPPGNPGGGIPGRICKTCKPWLTEAPTFPQKPSNMCVCMHVPICRMLNAVHSHWPVSLQSGQSVYYHAAKLSHAGIHQQSQTILSNPPRQDIHCINA